MADRDITAALKSAIEVWSFAPSTGSNYLRTAQAAAADALVRHVEAALAALAAATEDDDPTGLHTAQWQLRAALDAVKRGGV